MARKSNKVWVVSFSGPDREADDDLCVTAETAEEAASKARGIAAKLDAYDGMDVEKVKFEFTLDD